MYFQDITKEQKNRKVSVAHRARNGMFLWACLPFYLQTTHMCTECDGDVWHHSSSETKTGLVPFLANGPMSIRNPTPWPDRCSRVASAAPGMVPSGTRLLWYIPVDSGSTRERTCVLEDVPMNIPTRVHVYTCTCTRVVHVYRWHATHSQ